MAFIKQKQASTTTVTGNRQSSSYTTWVKQKSRDTNRWDDLDIHWDDGTHYWDRQTWVKEKGA